MSRKHRKFLFGFGLGLAAGWVLACLGWMVGRLLKINVPKSLSEHENQSKLGTAQIGNPETDAYIKTHFIENGIERIIYTPKVRRFETPILMQHGMWHAAWCWQPWQELLAEWGWESIAVSLPGHGNSPIQRPIPLCTLDYYLGFLITEIQRLPIKPVLMAHSMGGALVQWYFKYVGDDLPAAVMVAPWVSHATLVDGLPTFLKLDPLGVLQTFFGWDASHYMRSPERAAKALLSDGAVISPEELHAKLGPESGMIMFQHNPPFWKPVKSLKPPLLWLAGEHDALISESAQRKSADFYEADYVMIAGGAHNLMMGRDNAQIVKFIHDWLVAQGVD